MRIHNPFIITFICFISSFCFAQVQEQQINPTYLTIGDGLASPTVTDVMQDSYGLLWLATSNGLQKYDGYRFETYKHIPTKPTSLLNNKVWSLAEDNSHDIWVATDDGVSRFDRGNNEFINYPLAEILNLPLGSIVALKLFIDSQQRIWAATTTMELVRYNPETDQWSLADYEILNETNPIHTGFGIAITEDAQGGIWFGSSVHGLMHMGKDEKTFKPVHSDTWGEFDFSNPDNIITSLYSDTNNILWLTTHKGVYKFNPKTGFLKTLIEYKEDTNIIWKSMNSISPDQDGNIWVANNFRGILKFNGTTDTYTKVTLDGKMKMQEFMWDITMTRFIIDRSGIFWFGSIEGGLLKYDPVNKPFSYFSHREGDALSISPNGVFGLLASKVRPGTMYVGSRGGGLNVFDPKKRTFEKITFDVVDDFFGGSVRSIAEDTDGTLWLGTWGDGLIELDKNYQELNRYNYEAKNSNSISNNQVRLIKKDHQGKFWVGTNNGLNIFDPSTGNFQRLASKGNMQYPQNLVEELEKLSSSNQSIGLIDNVRDLEDRSQPITIETKGTYWVLSVGEGDTRSMVDYGWIENAQKDTIWSFGRNEDTFYAGGGAKNRIVIAPLTLIPGSYVLRYKADDSHAYEKWNENPPNQTSLYGITLIKPKDDAQTSSFEKQIAVNQNGIIMGGNNISDIEIGEKYIWVGASGQGLTRIDPVTNKATYYDYDPENENSISSNVISDILEDSKGILWLTTTEGINRLDPDSGKITVFTEADGLATNLTEAILEGDNGEMWIASQNGISQMVTNETLGKVTFINYNSSDGIGGDIFIPLGAARSSDGTFYFGGNHGLTTFNSITANNISPTLLISNVLISNKSVLDMGAESPLTESLLNTDLLNLSHQQNNLSFEFSALHFANAEKNQYAHKLIGYDKDWIYDNRNFASYTNLDPGKYKFAIRASNAYGIWNEDGKTLSITISAAWWQTWWAYVLFGVVTASILRAYIAFRAKKLKNENKALEERVEQRTIELKNNIDQLKATQSQLIQSEKMASLGELTAGIAHEIQNPLNFVNNFSEVSNELIDEMNEELDKGDLEEAKAISLDIKQNLERINHHGRRADSIVKGMLQHSRASGNKKEPTDINALTDEYLRLAYHGLRAKDKSFNADFKTNFDDSIVSIQIIPQDIGRVILNLITNAFYAVNEKKQQLGANYKPTVLVSTKNVGDIVEIRITDNGNGISKTVIDKIFQPFFTTKPTGKGTGLGLSMSYDIAKAHRGELKVETREAEGTTFIIELPKFITTN
ncbi:sensor histidine kinase [Maribacter sp. ACAM166]|uniref:sensor histidine kinase n=1 Tax=Maribacter sp. ACAM166 TaxID=2508996 RepID=UPI0010FEC0E0|nr:sensor histidine kinase [Maribacter sp. ACAM166]TLP80254.1 hypothetical protein ES765_08670 [Maribacter sp. ACAM166]